MDNPAARLAVTVHRPASSFPGSGARAWSPHRIVLLALLAGIFGTVIWAMLGATSVDRFVAASLTVAGALMLLVAARRRLVAGPDGFEVRSLARSRQIGWESVRSVRVIGNRRLGEQSAVVEVDLVDESLLIFGRTELGADPRTVGPTLRAWWEAWPPAEAVRQEDP